MWKVPEVACRWKFCAHGEVGLGLSLGRTGRHHPIGHVPTLVGEVDTPSDQRGPFAQLLHCCPQSCRQSCC